MMSQLSNMVFPFSLKGRINLLRLTKVTSCPGIERVNVKSQVGDKRYVFFLSMMEEKFLPNHPY